MKIEELLTKKQTNKNTLPNQKYKINKQQIKQKQA